MATDDYNQSVGQYTTLKTAVGGVQPSRIKTEDAGDSEDLASSIAKRKTGDPNAYERAPISGDSTLEDESSSDKAQSGGAGGDKEKKPGLLSRLKVPMIVLGAAVVTVVGAILAAAKQSKGAEEKDM